MGAGSQEEAHSVACSRSSKSPQARLPQPRQYPPWARSPLKRPPPAHLRSSTTQNTCHRPHVIAHIIFLTTLFNLYYYCFSLICYKYKAVSIFLMLRMPLRRLEHSCLVLLINSMEEEEKEELKAKIGDNNNYIG